jgi:XRE family transcriptional regulator, regulator of sulfur utilization
MDDEVEDLNLRIAAVIGERRRSSGLSISELARSAGLSKTILGRIESGRGNPSVETLYRIARALELPMSSFIAPEPVPRPEVMRTRSGPQLNADSGMATWLVYARELGDHVELFELELPAGTEQRSSGHLTGTEELVFCVSGRIRVGPVGDTVELRAGDAAWFRADIEHVYVAPRATRALNWIVTPVRR